MVFMRSWTIRILMSVISFTVILAMWQCASTLRWVNPVLLPAPSAIAPVAATLLVTGEFWGPLVQTLWLLCAGYAVACVSGVLVGLLVGRSERAYCLLEPLIEAIRPLPKPALIPIFFLFLGPGSAMKITMVSLAAFFPVLINTMQGVRGVDRVLLDTARTLGLSSFSLTSKIILPAALPLILAGMRVSLGLGLVLVILAEMLEADSGVGFQVLDLQRSFQVKEMYSWILVLAVVGLSLNSAFEWVEKRLTPWHSR